MHFKSEGVFRWCGLKWQMAEHTTVSLNEVVANAVEVVCPRGERGVYVA